MYADWHQIVGESESKSAEGQVRQGFSEGEGADKDWDIREC